MAPHPRLAADALLNITVSKRLMLELASRLEATI